MFFVSFFLFCPFFPSTHSFHRVFPSYTTYLFHHFSLSLNVSPLSPLSLLYYPFVLPWFSFPLEINDSRKAFMSILLHVAREIFVMTPFFKLHDKTSDSQMILSYESLFIKRYQPKLNVLKLWDFDYLFYKETKTIDIMPSGDPCGRFWSTTVIFKPA